MPDQEMTIVQALEQYDGLTRRSTASQEADLETPPAEEPLEIQEVRGQAGFPSVAVSTAEIRSWITAFEGDLSLQEPPNLPSGVTGKQVRSDLIELSQFAVKRCAPVTDDLIEKWRETYYFSRVPLLTVEVCAVWHLARSGRLETLVEVCTFASKSESPTSQGTVIVEAWDLLTKAVGEARRGLQILLGSRDYTLKQLETDQVGAALRDVAVLQQGTVSQLQRSYDYALKGHPREWSSSISELKMLVGSGDWLPYEVRDLSLAQVHSICRSAGLSGD